MKRRIQRFSLPKKIWEQLPESVRMIISADNCGSWDDGTSLVFDLTVNVIDANTGDQSELYTNTYRCDRDQVEWRLTGCRGLEPDQCPNCGQTSVPSLIEVDSANETHRGEAIIAEAS